MVFDSSWSDWHSVAGGYSVPTESGVYCVRASQDGKHALPIQRALGVDREGIVYVGESRNLLDRIGRLWWITDDNAQDHQHHSLIESWLYYDLDRLIPRTQLQIRWKPCLNHKAQESKLINDYKRAFGDIPIGNSSTGG